MSFCHYFFWLLVLFVRSRTEWSLNTTVACILKIVIDRRYTRFWFSIFSFNFFFVSRLVRFVWNWAHGTNRTYITNDALKKMFNISNSNGANVYRIFASSNVYNKIGDVWKINLLNSNKLEIPQNCINLSMIFFLFKLHLSSVQYVWEKCVWVELLT